MNQATSSMVTLTAVEVAKLLHCSPKTVQEKAGLGEIPGAKVGRHWFFKREDIQTYVNDEINRQTEARKNRYKAPVLNQPPARSYSKPIKQKSGYPDLTPYLQSMKP